MPEPLTNKKNNDNRINQLITAFSKAQNGFLTFSQTIQLLLTHGILTYPVTFTILYKKFIEANSIPMTPTKKVHNKPIEAEKVNLINEKTLEKEQLVFFLEEIGKHIYHNNKKYKQLLYNDLLIDKNEITAENKQRLLTVDESTKKVLTQEAILELIKFQKDLQSLYTCYLWENYHFVKSKNRLLLQPKDVFFQNKRMVSAGFVLLLKQSELCPNLISIQHIQQLIRTIIPSINQKQQHFYYKKLLTQLYHDDLLKRSKQMTDPNDPGMNFLEFQLMLMRIAWDSFPKEFEKKPPQIILRNFFKKLGLRSQENQQERKKQLLSHKKHLVYLNQYYSQLLEKQYVSPDQNQIQHERKQAAQNKYRQQISSQENLDLDVIQISKLLDRVLPKLPPIPQVKQECLPPFNENSPTKKINIGLQAPPEQKLEVKQAPKQIKKQVKQNKDEDPPRVFQWAKISQPVLSSENYIKQLSGKLSTQIKHLSTLQRGTINIQSIPSIISQSVFPTQLPRDSEENLNSLRANLVDKNFVLAFENLQGAYQGWKKYCVRNSVEMASQAELFFEYTRGSIFSSVGNFKRALNCYLNCRKWTEGGKMIFTNPDRSLPYIGLGQVFYQIEEYELAARAYLKARQIRQNLLRLQHVQTATTFCNLAACFFMLRRNTEALGYIQIGQNILSTQLGPYHERTMTARMNLKKIRRGQFDNKPNYRTLWQVFQKDQFGSEGKKKKAQKKKK